MPPIFSIIVSTHKRSVLLERALKSIYRQGVENIQIVVVSDVLDEDTNEVIQRCLHGNDIYIQRFGYPGPAKSRNAGLNLASGQYILFLDDDDSFEDGFFEKLIPHLSRKPKTVYHVNFDILYEDRSVVPAVELRRSTYSSELATRATTQVVNTIPNNCLIYPRETLECHRFDESLILFEDWQFLLSVLQDAELSHIAMRGPLIHKSNGELADRRGSTNDDRLVESIITIYRDYPAETQALNLWRQQHLKGADVDWEPPPIAETAKKPVFLHTIAYSETTLAKAEAGYQILNNLENPRPDWREYWPIRQFLLAEPLDESSYYGFFSPKFRDKTGLSCEDVLRFVQSAPVSVDAFLFSPQPDIGAFFPNPYIGGEAADTGYLSTCQTLVDRLKLGLNLSTLVLDSRKTAFSNFVVARPSYWREWLNICEEIFKAAESGDSADAFHNALRHKTPYAGQVERKVFVMEGVASLVLAMRPQVRVLAYNPFNLVWSEQLNAYSEQAVICDALKMATVDTGHPNYLIAYDKLQQQVLNDAFKPATNKKAPPMKQTPAHDLYNDTVLALMPSTLRQVLEVGCMRGTLSRVYRENNPACHWIGVDIDQDNVDIARTVCSEALCRDIETVSEDEYLQWAKVQAWIFGDTLEHLRDPWAVISKIRKVLPADGMVIASIPNAQHWSFQARVNVGQFRYEDDGLFDRTHLRFFTRITIFEMFEAAGYRIESAVARKIESPRAATYIPHIRAMAQASGHDPDIAETDAMAFQYVVKAVPA